MPNNEKEYNGYLLDQLELIERLEMVTEDNNIEVTSKKYQTMTLSSSLLLLLFLS